MQQKKMIRPLLFVFYVLSAVHASNRENYMCRIMAAEPKNEKFFIRAIAEGCSRHFEAYVASGRNLQVLDETGTPALSVAIFFHQYDLANRLIDLGFDLNFVGKTGPLEAAIMNGNLQMTHKLLLKWADPNRVNGEGFTPMQEATMFHDSSALELLMKYRGKLQVKDIKYALTLNVVKYYEKHGAGFDLIDERGKNLLHHVVERCYHPIWKDGMHVIMPEEQRRQHCVDLIEYLLKAGLNPNAKDADGKMPIDYSGEIYNEKAVLILKQAMKQYAQAGK